MTYAIGSLVTYRSTSGPVQAKVVDVIADIDQTYYALHVTSVKHSRYAWGTELLVPVDSNLLKYKRPSKPNRGGHNETHCLRGHEFTEDNTYYEIGELRTNVRRCRKCLRHHKNLWYARKVGKASLNGL